MPIYEYLCPACHNRVNLHMTYAEYGVKRAICPVCGGKDLKRLISRVRVAKSEEQRLEAAADPSAYLGGVDENDPKSIARAMKKMGREMGEDLPPEFDEITNRLESGESPDAIEKSMPELGGAESGGADDSDY
jgi:putative FmdB family regulatory protein